TGFVATFCFHKCQTRDYTIKYICPQQRKPHVEDRYSAKGCPIIGNCAGVLQLNKKVSAGRLKPANFLLNIFDYSMALYCTT
ncbi:MAG: hypothetical protein OSJ71_09485, partial [Acetatifactor sp.]|nr:hypothetical protein [Acetatifactor sp.]